MPAQTNADRQRAYRQRQAEARRQAASPAPVSAQPTAPVELPAVTPTQDRNTAPRTVTPQPDSKPQETQAAMPTPTPPETQRREPGEGREGKEGCLVPVLTPTAESGKTGQPENVTDSLSVTERENEAQPESHSQTPQPPETVTADAREEGKKEGAERVAAPVVRSGARVARRPGLAVPDGPCCTVAQFEAILPRYGAGEDWHSIEAEIGCTWVEWRGRGRLEGYVEPYRVACESREAAKRNLVEALGLKLARVASGALAARVEVSKGPDGRTRKMIRERSAATAQAAAAILLPAEHGRQAGRESGSTSVQVQVLQPSDGRAVLIAVALAQGRSLDALPAGEAQGVP